MLSCSSTKRVLDPTASVTLWIILLKPAFKLLLNSLSLQVFLNPVYCPARSVFVSSVPPLVCSCIFEAPIRNYMDFRLCTTPPTTNQSTRPTDDSDVINCQYCEKTFPTARGWSMHTKSAHPDEYHRNRIHLAPVRSVWTPQEDNLLCSRAAALLADGQLSLRELARRL
ncbi:hypothetical protein AAHC03_026822 [Spirometra sp. Aus1]